MDIEFSVTGTPIRFPLERWLHITNGHPEVAGYYYDILDTIRNPEAIYRGYGDELLATGEIEPGKCLIVVYKEESEERSSDGFIITAFITTRIERIQKKEKIWPR